MTNTYCPLIYHQLTVDNIGKVKPCCQFSKSIDYEKYDNIMQAFREDIEKGKQIEPCNKCYRDESKGLKSLRQVTIEDFKKYPIHKGLMFLDVRLHNSCNLACTMCSDHASSLWGKLKNKDTLINLDDDIKELFLSNAQDLVKLSIQGGEPFYGNEFIDFVDRIPNKQNIELEIFTNSITANIEVLSRWTKEFRLIQLCASVEGHGKTYESIRWPTTWEKFEKKIAAFEKIEKLSFDFHFLAMNINLLNLRDFIDWRNNNFPSRRIIFSLIESPAVLKIDILTEEERIEILDSFANIRVSDLDEIHFIEFLKKEINLSICDKESILRRDKFLKDVESMRNS